MLFDEAGSGGIARQSEPLSETRVPISAIRLKQHIVNIQEPRTGRGPGRRWTSSR